MNEIRVKDYTIVRSCAVGDSQPIKLALIPDDPGADTVRVNISKRQATQLIGDLVKYLV